MYKDKILFIFEQFNKFSVGVQLHLNYSYPFLCLFRKYFLFIELATITKDYLIKFVRCFQAWKTVDLLDHRFNLLYCLIVGGETGVNQLLILSLQETTLFKGFNQLIFEYFQVSQN